MSKLPEIRIYYAWLLEKEGYKLVEKPDRFDFDGYEKWAQKYRQEWAKYETKILTCLQDVLGVSFYKPVIDVPCAPYFTPKSDPLIMNFSNSSDEFVDTLTHELCHVLLTDNDKFQINAKNQTTRLDNTWNNLFGPHSPNTLFHIPVQALMKHIYIDVLKQPKRLGRDIKNSQKLGLAYKNSWQYVQDNDYELIISKLKKSYEELLA